jgi:hypothetical protein
MDPLANRSFQAQASVTVKNIFNFAVTSSYMQGQVQKNAKSFDSSVYTRHKQLVEYRKKNL